MPLTRIVTGGQTGVDRGADDVRLGGMFLGQVPAKLFTDETDIVAENR